jgi:hypothetical protein
LKAHRCCSAERLLSEPDPGLKKERKNEHKEKMKVVTIMRGRDKTKANLQSSAT